MGVFSLPVLSFEENQAKRWWHLLFKAIRFLFFLFPPAGLFSYFWHLFRGKVLDRQVGDFCLELDPQDSGLSRDFYIYGNHEVYSSAYLRQKLTAKRVVLDVGSSFGFYPLLEAQKIGPKGRIYALEPLKKSFQLLCKNIKQNKKEKVILPFRLALSSHDGEGVMYVKKKRNASFLNSLASERKKEEYVSAEKVRTVTLDSFLKDKPLPDLLRLDVEGMESKVFFGGRKVLKDIPEIMVEIHPHLISEKDFLRVLAFLKKYNFYPEAIIIDPYPFWMNPDGSWKKTAYLLTYLCGDRGKFGIFRGSWQSLKKAYCLKNVSFCVFFAKK